MNAFEPTEPLWIERLGNLRNVIRQELIARQLAPHVEPGASVLDVGCGQGTQALRLAQRGCRVTGVDVSATLLERFAADAAIEGVSVELVEGGIDELDAILDEQQFDLVCAHGLLMYVEDHAGAIAALAARVAPHGRLSFTVRNAHALAMRPGLRRDWTAALDAFGTREYVNELGADAVADRLEDVEQVLALSCFDIVEWFGVRVFNDAIPSDMPAPAPAELALLLEAEERAGRLDPYRWMASQFHVVAAPAATRVAPG
jgi:S-adenosylmethionine-dependent methyltransferase